MRQLGEQLAPLLSAGWEWGLLVFVVTFVGSLVLAVAIVLSWPADHFTVHRRPFWGDRHPALRAVGLVLKNLAGVFLLVLGLLMSVPGIPGQGLLTGVIGLTLVDFPGKHRIEGWAIRHPRVLRTLNRVRRRFHKPELTV